MNRLVFSTGNEANKSYFIKSTKKKISNSRRTVLQRLDSRRFAISYYSTPVLAVSRVFKHRNTLETEFQRYLVVFNNFNKIAFFVISICTGSISFHYCYIYAKFQLLFNDSIWLDTQVFQTQLYAWTFTTYTWKCRVETWNRGTCFGLKYFAFFPETGLAHVA